MSIQFIQPRLCGAALADLGPVVGAGLGTAIITGHYLYRRYNTGRGPQHQAPYLSAVPHAPPPPSTISHQRLTLDQLVFIHELGKGSFGTVYLAELKRQRGKYVAVKVLEKWEVLQNNNLKFATVERRVLTLARNNHFLAHLYSTFQDKDHLYFVMEFVSGGSLASLIRDGPLDLARSRFYSAEIVVGLQFLHSNGVIHRDLKLDNVMLDRDGHIKIIDFGLSTFMGDRKLTTSHYGTLLYMSPQVIISDPYSYSADWWSFGILLHELLTGGKPYYGDDVDTVMVGILCMDHWWSSNKEANDLLDKLLDVDPRLRLGEVGNIRNHPFYDTISWSALEKRVMDPPEVEQVCSDSDLEDSEDSVHQEQFAGFSYIDPKMEDLLMKESCPAVEPDVEQSKSETGVSPWLCIGAAVLATGALFWWLT